MLSWEVAQGLTKETSGSTGNQCVTISSQAVVEEIMDMEMHWLSAGFSYKLLNQKTFANISFKKQDAWIQGWDIHNKF